MPVAFEELRGRAERILLGLGFAPDRARLGARLTAEADCDGVTTHGIARLPRFAEMVRSSGVVVTAEPERVVTAGALEQWTGHRGPGNLAAHAMCERAMTLARQFGVGCVALGDTTHWMRGGTYGWQAAEAGFALLAWTNTMPNMPAWGALRPVLGNNPLVVAAPRAGGPVVLDMAMSQFSYGALTKYRESGEMLPAPGGFDEAGELTRDPGVIERTGRALPVGFWKGSGLAFVLDLLGAMLSGGRATHEIEADPLREVGLSQVFLAVDARSVGSLTEMERIADGCVAALWAAEPSVPGKRPRYPGEETMRVRERSLREGVSVEEGVWERFLALERELGVG